LSAVLSPVIVLAKRSIQRRSKQVEDGMARTAVLGEVPFAVVDIETTGIYPAQHDRIIEIAVVRTRPDLQVEDEWTTLVNPRRDIGRTDVHGIRAGDVADAPEFREILGDVAARLQDAVVVAHHLRFETMFLRSEFERCRAPFPALPGVCTLDLAYRLLPEAPSRKLACCCEQLGIRHEEEHTALGDARATAYLVAAFIEWQRQRRPIGLGELGCAPLNFPSDQWLFGLPSSGRCLSRKAASARRTEERSYLARLIERTLGDEAASACQAEYLELVDRALQDRRIVADEATLLVNMAESWGMTRSDVLEAHRAYLLSLASEALRDGVVSDAERHDLEDVCDLLGLHRAVLESMLVPSAHRPAVAAASTARTPHETLRGRSVCFTGEIVSSLGGERITREIAEKLAIEAGLDVQQSVTKKLDILVVADPDTQSIKARKAREYGIRIIAERAFWKALGVPAE
jgi:DNA polymerase-3 subunit epsilon